MFRVEYEKLLIERRAIRNFPKVKLKKILHRGLSSSSSIYEEVKVSPNPTLLNSNTWILSMAYYSATVSQNNKNKMFGN